MLIELIEVLCYIATVFKWGFNFKWAHDIRGNWGFMFQGTVTWGLIKVTRKNKHCLT
jgi:hypothetical protein